MQSVDNTHVPILAMHFSPHQAQCQPYLLVSQLDEAVNLLGRDLRLELLLIDDDEEL